MAAGSEAEQGKTTNRRETDRRAKNGQLIALGNRLRQIRSDRGFSQEDFAATIGLARTYYGEVERGERNIAALNLMKIALVVDVEVGELFPSLASLRSIKDTAG